jgi:DNA-binding ferritin-like protein
MKKRAINNNDGAFQKKIVSTFLCMLNTVKLYHWSTVHYSTHKATDELYSGLSSKIDTFVETMFGKESIAVRQKVLQMNSIHIHSMQTNRDFKNETEQYKSFLINLTNNKTFNIQKNTDLMNMRDDILGSLNQFLYLLTLK